MARETITVQSYPDDYIINETIKEYEAFGWELLNNQRCQEYEGQTQGLDGSSTKHYSTFNKLTFSREKASPWYSRIVPMEAEYRSLVSEKPERPQNKHKMSTLTFYILGVIALVIGIAFAIWISPILLVAAVGGALCLVYAICRTVIGKKRTNTYRFELADWKKNQGVRAEKLLKYAERIVNGIE